MPALGADWKKGNLEQVEQKFLEEVHPVLLGLGFHISQLQRPYFTWIMYYGGEVANEVCMALHSDLV